MLCQSHVISTQNETYGAVDGRKLFQDGGHIELKSLLAYYMSVRNCVYATTSGKTYAPRHVIY